MTGIVTELFRSFLSVTKKYVELKRKNSKVKRKYDLVNFWEPDTTLTVRKKTVCDSTRSLKFALLTFNAPP